MKILVIQTFEDEIVGAVIQDDHGGLEVQGATLEYEVALRQLIEFITSKPIPYRTGEERETPEGIEHITMVKMCRKGDPEFFDALEDALPKYSLLGKRIEGILLTEEREEAKIFQPLVTPAYAVREKSKEYKTES
jgi:hypothetical protein